MLICQLSTLMRPDEAWSMLNLSTISRSFICQDAPKFLPESFFVYIPVLPGYSAMIHPMENLYRGVLWFLHYNVLLCSHIKDNPNIYSF